MSQKKTGGNATARDAKRARFSEPNTKKPGGASVLVLAAGVLVVLALIGGTAFALSRSPDKAASASSPSSSGPQAAKIGSEGLVAKAATLGHDPYPAIAAENGVISLPAATFDDGQARFYTFMQDGRPIEFFVLRDSGGVLRVAFNACDVCFPAKKGYHQEGDEMVCNNCGSRFPAAKIGLIRGGCNPAPLAHKVDGTTLTIQVSDLVAGLSYF
jgi:hypothetical protein